MRDFMNKWGLAIFSSLISAIIYLVSYDWIFGRFRQIGEFFKGLKDKVFKR